MWNGMTLGVLSGGACAALSAPPIGSREKMTGPVPVVPCACDRLSGPERLAGGVADAETPGRVDEQAVMPVASKSCAATSSPVTAMRRVAFMPPPAAP